MRKGSSKTVVQLTDGAWSQGAAVLCWFQYRVVKSTLSSHNRAAHLDAVQADDVTGALHPRQRRLRAKKDEIYAVLQARRLLRRRVHQHKVHHPVCSRKI